MNLKAARQHAKRQIPFMKLYLHRYWNDRSIKEPIHGKLLALRDAMGEEDFNRYINSLLRITYNGRALWLITRSERNRTLIEGKYLPLIAKIFDVAAPRVFSQP